MGDLLTSALNRGSGLIILCTKPIYEYNIYKRPIYLYKNFELTRGVGLEYVLYGKSA